MDKTQENMEVQDTLPAITVFRFPKDDALKKKWLKSIPRENFEPSKYSAVCVRHFYESDLIYVPERNRKELRDGAIPRIFPNTPKYLSKKEEKERTNPREKVREKISNQLKEEADVWLQSDIIQDFELFKKMCREKEKEISEPWQLKMICKVRINNFVLPKKDLNWILCPNSIVSRWSLIENILSRYKSFNAEQNLSLTTLISNVDMHLDLLLSFLQRENRESIEEQRLRFFQEQFTLIFSQQKYRRYSVNMTLWAFMVFFQSFATYSAIRETGNLVLPHPKYLQQLSSSYLISPKNDLENRHFLRTLNKKLSDSEKFVVLQLDEIYVSQRTEYKGGEIYGQAENDVTSQAKTVQAFMISSAFGRFKEIVSLHPVRNISGKELYDLTQKVISLITECEFHVISVILDNIIA